MADILLIHSVRGLRDLERDAAGRLRAEGHVVATPDLFDGRTADTAEAGMAIAEALGPERVAAAAAAATLPGDAVLAGLSGAFVACGLLADRPAAAGLVLLHGPGPIPAGVRPGLPAQWHMAEPDPFDDEDFLAAWQDDVRAAGVALDAFRYPGAGHLFTDPSLPDHDATAAAALWRRATDFLAAL
ncbi:MAG: dienelactone hydrolase family protein [Amaricoccus sp.]|nr:dienelactone hydrolase family protein [Amaricoccus sp.]